jgi:hypothetical protein
VREQVEIHGRACTQVLFLHKTELRIFSLFRDSDRLVVTFHRSRSGLQKTSFFRQVRELKIQRRNPGSALWKGTPPLFMVYLQLFLHI